MTRQLGLPLAAGLLSSLLFLSLAKGLAFGTVLSYLSPLPLLMVGLRNGMVQLVISGLCGMSAIAAVADGVSVLPYLGLAFVPSAVITNRALLWRNGDNGSVEWYPPGMILAWLTAAGLVMMLFGASLLSGTPGGIKAWVKMILANTLDLLAAGLPPEAKDRAVSWWAPFFPAMVCGSWLLMTVLNAVAAQGLLTRLGQAQRPRPVYRQLVLPDGLAAGLGLAGVIAAISQDDTGYVAVNAAVFLALPFSFLGLATIHTHSQGRKNARVILAGTYGLLVLVSGWAVALLAGIGLVRFWTMRFRRPKQSGGMEG